MKARGLKACPHCGSMLLADRRVESGAEYRVWLCHNEYCELNVPARKQQAALATIGAVLRLALGLTKMLLVLGALYGAAQLLRHLVP